MYEVAWPAVHHHDRCQRYLHHGSCSSCGTADQQQGMLNNLLVFMEAVLRPTLLILDSVLKCHLVGSHCSLVVLLLPRAGIQYFVDNGVVKYRWLDQETTHFSDLVYGILCRKWFVLPVKPLACPDFSASKQLTYLQ